MLYTLVDIIFKGEYAALNFIFLKDLLLKAREVRFSYPEIFPPETYEALIEVFRSNSYADLALITDYLEINKVNVPHVFINLTRDENGCELLFYFDVKEFGIGSYKKKLEDLENWARAYSANYGFNYLVCKMDNGNSEEYYFDSAGHGPLDVF